MDDGDLEVGTESVLIRHIVAGDDQAFHELVQPYQRSVYLTALSILKDEANAEEAAQVACVLPGIVGPPLRVRAWRKHQDWNEADHVDTALERRGSISNLVCNSQP